MGNIYAGIDLGTDSIKIVVASYNDDKYYVLASSCSPSFGISHGFITDTKLAVSSVKNCLKKINDMLGIKITKVIACIPPDNCKMDIVLGSCNIVDYQEITGVDVKNVLMDAIKGQDLNNDELVTAMPINFTIDDKNVVSDPKGMKGTTLETKLVISTVPKEPLYRILQVLKLSGLDTVDICFTSVGDYFSIKNKKNSELVGAIVNIGEDFTNVSIFNRGIQIKNSVLQVGSNNVDKDISYVFKCNNIESRKIKENFAVCLTTYADSSDTLKIEQNDGEIREVNQVGVSKIVEARVREILKLVKNEIKNLTNREIRYIIITGGLSELAGFSYLVEQEFGFVAKVCNMPVIGVRHNKYSSCFGAIKYFHEKLALRGTECEMISREDERELTNVSTNQIDNENMISKVFGHFFDN